MSNAELIALHVVIVLAGGLFGTMLLMMWRSLWKDEQRPRPPPA